MNFLEQFPSLCSTVSKEDWARFEGLSFFDFYADCFGHSEFDAEKMEEDVMEHCLDKQRVKDSILKALKDTRYVSKNELAALLFNEFEL
jgi:hypothetical protein